MSVNYSKFEPYWVKHLFEIGGSVYEYYIIDAAKAQII